jgi:hypothetical protein
MANIYLKITLKSEYTGSGSNPGPFNITANPGGLTFNNVSKTELASGYYINVPDTVTGGTITATGVCTNSIPWIAPSTGTANCSTNLAFGTIDSVCTDNNTKTKFTINVTGNGTSTVQLNNGTSWIEPDSGFTNRFTVIVPNDSDSFTFSVRLKNCTNVFSKTLTKCSNVSSTCQTKIDWGENTRTCDYENYKTTHKISVVGASATTYIQFSKDNGVTWDAPDTNKYNEKTYVIDSETNVQQYYLARISGCTTVTTSPKSPIDGNLTKCSTTAPTGNVCANIIRWDTSKNTSSYENNIKTFTVFVQNNDNNMVQFSLDNSTFSDATSQLKNNEYTFTKPCTATDTTIFYYAKLKGCSDIITGSTTTYCGGEGNYSYGVSMNAGGKVKIGTEELTSSTVIKRTSASISLNGTVITANNGYRIVSYSISQGAATDATVKTLPANTSTYTITEGSMSSTTADYQTLTITFAPNQLVGTPSFTLEKIDANCLQVPQLVIKGAPGLYVRYCHDSTFTCTNNGCTNPDGVIPSEGELRIPISTYAKLDQSETYTVRVYNGAGTCNVGTYKDLSITFNAVSCPSAVTSCQYGETFDGDNSLCDSQFHTLFFDDTCKPAAVGCTVYTGPARIPANILTGYSYIQIEGVNYSMDSTTGKITGEITDNCNYQEL